MRIVRGMAGKSTRCGTRRYRQPEMQAYCAFQDRFDLHMGLCLFACRYCFLHTGPGGGGTSNRKFMNCSYSSLQPIIESAGRRRRMAIVGVCNDPSLSSSDRIEWMLDQCDVNRTYLSISTKNPGRFIPFLDMDRARRVSFKVSMAMFRDVDCSILEPNAPLLSKRLDDMGRLLHMRADVQIRLQPFFLGYYEGLEGLLNRFAGRVERLVVEPVRMHAPGIKHFMQCDPALYLDNYSVREYLHRWCLPGKNGGPYYFGPLHWYEYDPALVHQEHIRLKRMAHNAKMKFGMCSGYYGWKDVYLNDGPDYCCSTTHKMRHGVTCDSRGLCTLGIRRQIDSNKIESLANTKMRDEFKLELGRLEWINDPAYVPYPYTDTDQGE